MEYKEFQKAVYKKAAQAGIKQNTIQFETDKGKHTAYCGDITICGNTECNKIMVSWGNRGDLVSAVYGSRRKAIAVL